MLLFFVLGVLLSGVIDTIIPHLFHLHTQEEYDDSKLQDQDKHWLTSGLVTALAIGGHNLPEGMITFTSTLADPTVGLSIALAVALHNIPEGLAIALPVYKATHNRLQTLWYTVVAGLAEPLGALLGFWFLSQFLGDYALGFIFAIVAGIMIYISFDEILPTAFYKGNTHQVLYAILAGMIVMGSSLIWLG
jgi:ZIP family zinc transporter